MGTFSFHYIECIKHRNFFENMDFNLLQKLRTLPARDLHFVYGVNCYQFAIGYLPPIINRLTTDGSDYIEYVGLFPGAPSAQRVNDITKPPSLQAGIQSIIAGCREDGLIDCEKTPLFKRGHTTVAMLIKDKGGSDNKFDFHFAQIARDGSCFSKLPYRTPVRHNNVGELERDISYQLNRYFLVPNNLVPQSIKAWNAEAVIIKLGDDRPITLMEFKAALQPQGSFLFGERVLMTGKNDMAYSERFKTVIVAPPWPPCPQSIVHTENIKEAHRSGTPTAKARRLNSLHS